MPKKVAKKPADPEICRRLKVALDQAGKTQRDLARHCRVTDPTVSAWVTGIVTPRPHRLVAIADFVGESIDWLMNRETMDRVLSSKLVRLAEILGRDRIEYLHDLSAEELIGLVDAHELARSRARRRADRSETRDSSGT